MRLYQSSGIFRMGQLMSSRAYLSIPLFLICLLAIGFISLNACTSSSSDQLAKDGESMARARIVPFVVRCGDSFFVKELGPDPDFFFSRKAERYIELKGKVSYEYSVASLKESEKLNGIEHKAKLFFKCGGPSRTWYQKTGWGAWRESGYSALVEVVKQNGKWTTKEIREAILVEDPPKLLTFTCEQIPGLNLSASTQKDSQADRGKVTKKGGPIDVNGNWQLIWEGSAARLPLMIVQSGSELRIQGARINGTGTLNGDEISWTVSLTSSGGSTRGVTYTGKVQGDTMAGTATPIQGSGPASSANRVRKWTAVRIAK